MKKIKLCFIYGGVSCEHDVSIDSFNSIIKNIDKEKYDIYQTYINKNNVWYQTMTDMSKRIDNVCEYLKNMDVVFPVLHGKNGEDGTLQGMLEILNIPYVGCEVLSSSLCMDKIYTKMILDKYNINQVNYAYIKKINDDYIYIDDNFDEFKCNIDLIADKILSKLKLPLFVKPSRCGSSVGINKSNTKDELINNIQTASIYDNKIIIEEAHDIIEVECGVLNEIASTVGEIIPKEEFYSYDEKYKSNKTKTIIPADITDEESNKIKKLAVKAFKILDCKDLARVDFFIDKNTREIYLNEVNTLPGFTNISMYPKLFEYDGITYAQLIDKLILNNYKDD